MATSSVTNTPSNLVTFRVHDDAAYRVNEDGSETFIRQVTKLPPAAADGSHRPPQFRPATRLLRDWNNNRKPDLAYYEGE